MGKYTSPKFQIYVESPQLGQVRYFHIVVSGSRQSTQTGAFGSWADSVSKKGLPIQPLWKLAGCSAQMLCLAHHETLSSEQRSTALHSRWTQTKAMVFTTRKNYSHTIRILFALIPSSKSSWLRPSLGDSSMSPSLGCVKLKGLNSWDVDVDIQSIPFFVFDQRCRYLTGQQKQLEWNPPCSPLKEKNKWFWDDISSRHS